jgi:hypothetical protein
VIEKVETVSHRALAGLFVNGKQFGGKLREMLAGVVEIDDLDRAGEMLISEIPDPDRTITDQYFLLGLAPSTPPSLGVDPEAELFGGFDGRDVGRGIFIAYGPTVLAVCAAEFDSRSCALCDCAAVELLWSAVNGTRPCPPPFDPAAPLVSVRGKHPAHAEVYCRDFKSSTCRKGGHILRKGGIGLREVGLLLVWPAVLVGQVPAHTQHSPNISNGLTLYGALGFSPSSLRSGINTWMGNRFDWIWGGSILDPRGSAPTKVWWAGYTDMAFLYQTGMYGVQTTAEANGWNLEDMMLHQSIDMQVASGYQWKSASGPDWGPGKFDGFESSPPGTGMYYGGVFTYNGTTWSDCTYCAYKGAISKCQSPFTVYYGNPTVGGTLYVGLMEPFDQINFGTLQQSMVGGSVAFNYWNGSVWTTLTDHLSDGTSGLTTSGKIRFYPPADWARKALVTGTPFNNGYSKYWIQIVVTGATTSPVFGTIYGDDWSVSSGTNNTRGWAPSDPNRINVGTRQEYNPTPPANASAKFRHQARVTGFWASNAMFGNPSNIQGGVHTWGRYLTDYIDAQMASSGCTTVAGAAANCTWDSAFFDDAGGMANNQTSPAWKGGKPWQHFDYTGAASETGSPGVEGSHWLTAVEAMYSEMVPRMKGVHGNNFRVGLNAGTQAMAQAGDFNFVEGWYVSAGAPNPNYYYTPEWFQYDGALPEHNPAGVRYVVTCGDNSKDWSPSQGLGHTYWHYVDKANRTPMSCLIQHYLGMNANTSFAYTTTGYGYYSETDEVYTFSTPTTTTEAIASCSSGCNTTIAVTDGSGAENYGTGSCTAPAFAATLRLGSPTSGDTLTGCVSGNTFTSTNLVYNAYSPGSNAYFVVKQHQSVAGTPPFSNVYRWGPWFPARGLDIGGPDPAGYRGGARAITETGNTPWKKGGSPDYISGQSHAACDAHTCSDLWRRDFTRAIVLFRPWSSGWHNDAELDTPSQPIALGGTYYPLNADGTTGPGVTSVTLRGGEGAILMKAGGSGSACDLNGDGSVGVGDAQVAINQTLGLVPCGSADLDGDGKCTVIDASRVIYAGLGMGCRLGP